VVTADIAGGSVTDWISVLLALVTAGASAVAYFLRGRNRKLSAERDQLSLERNDLRETLQLRELELANTAQAVELERARTAAFDELSDQARRVSAVPHVDADGRRVYRVINDSDLPIFDLEARVYAGTEEPFNNMRPTLDPKAEYEAFFPGNVGPVGCDLRFRDYRGNYWRVDGFGTLTRMEGYTPRVRAVPPGFFDT
jgi:cell division protein FtsL